MNSDQVGTLTEQQCITYIIGRWFNVSVPVVKDKYDFILDYKGKLLKVQTKTSRVKGNSILFNGFSSTRFKGKRKEHYYTKDDIDFYITFYNNMCYLVPVGEVSKQKRLWFAPPKNGYTRGVCMLNDYEFEIQLSKLDTD